ncbi:MULTISPECIES: ABC transporter ATP-binding protein [unclassified Microbacterium]|uniref:ABC transporter ATP-binding protein n=1 Tax=unclassified Microbacterium TaxID=2609290 RepID=UPI001D6201E6|nr:MULTISPECIES: ABC transporter ATP-binding protein [unclassified Microbacterium]CAH0145343.1 Lipopolysaccharide export system ATP-binding protein LptB [Microbacterium sp. Bi121]HWK77855.1 ABC transporter ATP-binding protein [Microbacterium sp.]
MSEHVLALEGVSKQFGGLKALSDVSLRIPARSRYGLIGPNGAGKSTLINAITGISPPSSGRVVLDGSEIQGRRAHHIARLGIGRTFQTSAVLAGMTVLENVAVGAFKKLTASDAESVFALPRARRQQRSASEAAEALLDEVGLADLAHRPVEELPYGKLRLVEIARALASDPLLICLDEPAAGLNPSEVEQVGQTLRGLEKRGVALLLVEHNMKLVFSVVDELTVLHHGSVIAQGDPATVREHPEVLEAYLGSRRGE